MPTESEAFLELPIALGFGPATGPTLKTALCHIRTLVGRRINNGYPPAFWLGRLAFVPGGCSKPRAGSGPNRPPASGGRTAFSDPFARLV